MIVLVVKMSHSRVLVLAATGNQGSTFVKQLLARGHPVHALTRNNESRKSKELEFAGATLFQGSFEDFDSIKVAAEGCDVMFLVVPSGQSEVDHARNAIKAAQATQIQKCIYSSVANCEKVLRRSEFDHTSFRASYFLNKSTIQDLIMSQFQSWTILQPVSLMTNLVDPLARVFFPNLGGQHVLDGPWKLECPIGWVDPVDIGKFAVMAAETDRLENKVIPLVGETLTVPELSRIMSRISEESITFEYVGDEAVTENKDQNPIFATAGWIIKGWLDVEKSSKTWPQVELNSLDKFLTRQKESGMLEKTLLASSA